ncbi:MAG: nitroreductase family protein [Deltaproteobacteria bacterium]|nr:nitroreductase family protein [Deltaproteobacteria bacterium]
MPRNENGDHFLDLLLGRRSIRRYQQKSVPQELVDKLLTAAIWAPSAHNRQPWRFVVISALEKKSQLAQAMGDRLKKDLTHDGVETNVIENDVSRSYRRITAAPLLVLICSSMEDMDSYPDERRQINEWTMAVQSTAMAGQNLLLAAHALGLGACWMCAPLFCPEVVQEVLELPVNWEPQGLVTIGYPAEKKVKSRRPLHSCTKFLSKINR